MYHPWRTLPGDVVVEHKPLPPRVRGRSKGRTIELHDKLEQIERRCVLEHEKVHLERGDPGRCNPAVESAIDRIVARRLISFDQLAAAMAWTDQLPELADELWVTPEIAQARIDVLWPSEVTIISELIADLRT